MGWYSFAAQYQQAPIAARGNMIDPHWIRRYAELPNRTSSSIMLQSWDTASKEGELNDYSACATLAVSSAKDLCC
jgi:phage terminase large subunit-like protein